MGRLSFVDACGGRIDRSRCLGLGRTIGDGGAVEQIARGGVVETHPTAGRSIAATFTTFITILSASIDVGIDVAAAQQHRPEDGVVGADVAEGGLEGIIGGTLTLPTLALALLRLLSVHHGREVVHDGDVEVIEQVGAGGGVVEVGCGSGGLLLGLLGKVEGIDRVHRGIIVVGGGVGESVGANGRGGGIDIVSIAIAATVIDLGVDRIFRQVAVDAVVHVAEVGKQFGPGGGFSGAVDAVVDVAEGLPTRMGEEVVRPPGAPRRGGEEVGTGRGEVVGGMAGIVVVAIDGPVGKGRGGYRLPSRRTGHGAGSGINIRLGRSLDGSGVVDGVVDVAQLLELLHRIRRVQLGHRRECPPASTELLDGRTGSLIRTGHAKPVLDCLMTGLRRRVGNGLGPLLLPPASQHHHDGQRDHQRQRIHHKKERHGLARVFASGQVVRESLRRIEAVPQFGIPVVGPVGLLEGCVVDELGVEGLVVGEEGVVVLRIGVGGEAAVGADAVSGHDSSLPPLIQ
mmetsp:Transcript_5530/g.13245  ORF Transcript_5530/g.13245 Transcript_5530/m.13245 type:complete len:513 (+) Transcript_5530:2555-4093(+)